MPTSRTRDIQLSRTLPRTADIVIAGLTADGAVGLPDSIATALKKQHGTTAAELAETMGGSTTPLTTTVLRTPDGRRIVLVRLATEAAAAAEPTRAAPAAPGQEVLEQLRRAAGAGVRTASGLPGRSHNHRVEIAVGFDRHDPAEIRATGEGALLGGYTFAPLGSQPTERPEIARISVLTKASSKQHLAAVEAAGTTARAVVANRDWVNQPANLLYPESFADEGRGYLEQVGNGNKIKTEVLDEKDLARGGYGGLLAVGGGSQRSPRLVRMSYAPRGAKFHLALVGKGITFDSGGLDLKTPSGMYIMKSDMSGAGAVMATIGAIAELGLKIKVTGYAAMAENMPSGSAYRPSDVLTIHGGKTVENTNTDAEGRLVMADALARATEDEPDLIIDVATLTGASITALGERTGGMLANDDDAARRVLAAAQSAGESLWQLPMAEGIREQMDSQVADVASARSGPGGAITAAFFLREFVSDVPWAHLDIAGPSFHDGTPYGYVPAGGTGIGVRTLIRLAESLAS